MRFAEFGFFGVYVAPIVPLMLCAGVATMGLRRVADRFGLLRHVWNPALFMLATYVLMLGTIVLAAAAWGFAWRI